MSGTKGVVNIRIEGLAEALAGIDAPLLRLAARATLADLAKMAKTEASTAIREKFNIRKGDLDPRLRVMLPTFASLSSELKVSGLPIPLIYFGAKQLRDVSAGVVMKNARGASRLQRRAKGARGVSYQIETGKSETIAQAFIAYHSRWARFEVFMRKGRGRYPLRTFRSITVASMFEQPRVVDRVVDRIQAQFDSRFQQNLEYFAARG